MAIALLIAGVAFAAFCVWLMVRLVNRDRYAIKFVEVLGMMFGPVVLTLVAIVAAKIMWNLATR